MHTNRNQANTETSLLREQVKSLEKSLKFIQAHHEEVSQGES